MQFHNNLTSRLSKVTQMNRLREGPGKGPCYAFGSIDLALVIQSFQAQLNLLVGMICVSKSAPVSLTRNISLIQYP